MNNRDTQATWKYHDGTKHSYWSIRNNPHFLDWANRPLPFKIYPGIENMPLPREVSQTGVAALSALPHPLFLGGNYQAAHLPRRRNLLSCRSLHRSTLRDRTLRCDRRSLGLEGRRVSLQSGGGIAGSSAKRRLLRKPF